MKRRVFFLLDFETTGLNAKEAEPIQASVRFLDEDLKQFYSKSTFLLADKPELILLPEETVHKITKEMLTMYGWDQKAFFKEVCDQVYSLRQQFNVILTGHNVIFDRNFLVHHSQLHGQTDVDYTELPVFDTLDLARMLLLGPKRIARAKLEDVARYIGMNFLAHDASEDTAVCVAFMRYLRQHAAKHYEMACQGGYMNKMWAQALSCARRERNADLEDALFGAMKSFEKERRFSHNDTLLIYNAIKG